MDGWFAFPNPATDAITLDFLQPLVQDISLRLLSPTGESISEGRLPAQTKQVRWNISGLKPSMYLLEVWVEGKIQGI